MWEKHLTAWDADYSGDLETNLPDHRLSRHLRDFWQYLFAIRRGKPWPTLIPWSIPAPHTRVPEAGIPEDQPRALIVPLAKIAPHIRLSEQVSSQPISREAVQPAP